MLIRRLSIFCGVFVCVAFGAEFALRLVLGLGHPVLYIVDPRFGSFPRGDQHLQRFFVPIEINHFGMRSQNISATKTRGEYRILFVGDSVPFGTTLVGQKDIFVERIADYYHSRGAKVSVMNASSPGWAPSNELRFIEVRGLYSADLVVLVYNTKDLTQPFSSYKPSPLVPLANPPTAIGELWSRYISPKVFRTRAVYDPGSVADGPAQFADVPAVLDTIERTRQAVVARGARFAILFSPAETDDIKRNESAWSSALDKLRDWAATHDVTFIDLTPALAAQRAEKVYFDGIHLRPEGNAVAAEVFTSWFNQFVAR